MKEITYFFKWNYGNSFCSFYYIHCDMHITSKTFYHILGPWMLIFQGKASDVFNETANAFLSNYNKEDMEGLKHYKGQHWYFKLNYDGYSETISPHILWTQTSNPFARGPIQGFNIVENNLKR